MKVQNLNKSSINTKAQIKSAFVDLMHEKRKISSVSVSELVKRIGINRTTFYTHYHDLYDVARDIAGEVSMAALDMEISTKEDIPVYIESMFNNLYKNRNMYNLLLSSREPMYYLENIRKQVCRKLLEVYEKYTDDKMIGFKLEVFTDGLEEQLVRYFKNKSEYKFDELKNYFVNFALELF